VLVLELVHVLELVPELAPEPVVPIERGNDLLGLVASYEAFDDVEY